MKDDMAAGKPATTFQYKVYHFDPLYGLQIASSRGGSLYEPRPEFQMMQVEAIELEAELALRADRRVPAAGIEYICVQGLRDAGVLSGVRAMVARGYTAARSGTCSHWRGSLP